MVNKCLRAKILGRFFDPPVGYRYHRVRKQDTQDTSLHTNEDTDEHKPLSQYPILCPTNSFPSSTKVHDLFSNGRELYSKGKPDKLSSSTRHAVATIIKPAINLM